MIKERNPVSTVFKTQWDFLGDKKKTFYFYSALFFIAAVIDLMNPLVIGLIFNKVQQQITSHAELTQLLWMIFLLLGIDLFKKLFFRKFRICGRAVDAPFP